MNNVRTLVTTALQQMPAHSSTDQNLLAAALQALVQLGDQLNTLQRNQQNMQQTIDRIARDMR